MGRNSARSVRSRSRAALLAGAAAAALLAWGWLSPADGSVPGWEPVNAQVATAVAEAERSEGKTEGTHEATSSAQAVASAASVRPVESAGSAEPEGNGSKTNVDTASDASEIQNVETAKMSDAAEKDGRLDINAASAADLDALPGIGPSKAEAIVQYRDAHGRFESPEALTDVKGIGDKLLAKLLPLIKAG
ncbi:helix-hairpin-helix domain-containing protein [Cohnella ginsengisoli]|uniref:Helix-hairpin-helix domain-containing protein n=1 Tax=Cohnella ginsengisoli TaxID=425004 RepID=A0A9X4KJZ7_9BACL|nr:helix-hairpin-helix domain-containing protein [Cohnella ginsengisoli]MDG0793156.1 helix-hairpin-helix domain-containing protein [Cohnella ginsengisoli]